MGIHSTSIHWRYITPGSVELYHIKRLILYKYDHWKSGYTQYFKVGGEADMNIIVGCMGFFVNAGPTDNNVLPYTCCCSLARVQ